MDAKTNIIVTSHIAKHLKMFALREGEHYSVSPSSDERTFSVDDVRLGAAVQIEHIGSSTDEEAQGRIDQRLLAQISKQMRLFRTLSLMGGAGGMDIGLCNPDNEGFFRTDWAIEWSSVSLKTFRSHHPFTRTFEMDVGQALRERQTLEGMPTADQVDAIIMGPPCQSFSSLNRVQTQTRKHDARSLLVATGLSFVDVYRPTYGVIENVQGMLTRGHLGNVPKDGVIRFIRNCLDTLGYNSRFCSLQCGHFGIPQSRKRVKILFSLKEVRLPLAPLPTTKLAGEADGTKGGPGPAITIKDATSDLPRWEYANPLVNYGTNKATADTRPSLMRPVTFSKRTGKAQIGPKSCRYICTPRNDFQRSVRPGPFSEANANVSQHYTVALDELSIERICNIPFRPHANHLDLLSAQPALALGHSIELEDSYAMEHAYSRLDANEASQIVTTTLHLGGKQGRILMPDQARIPTVRELARFQGFPDGIKFHGSPAQIVKQIGNAVPVPLATAIGLSIRQAAVADFLDGDRRFARSGSRPL